MDDEPVFINGIDYLDLKMSTQKATQKTTHKTTHKTTQKQRDILAYLLQHPKAGRKELAAAIDDITEDGVKYNLKVLQERKLINRVGSDKGGHWEVVDEKT